MMLDQNICTRLVEFLNEHCLFFILRLLDLLITSLKTMTHQCYYFLWRVNAIAVLRWKHFAEDNIVLFSKNLVSLLSWNSKYIHWCLYGITVIIYYGHYDKFMIGLKVFWLCFPAKCDLSWTHLTDYIQVWHVFAQTCWISERQDRWIYIRVACYYMLGLTLFSFLFWIIKSFCSSSNALCWCWTELWTPLAMLQLSL